MIAWCRVARLRRAKLSASVALTAGVVLGGSLAADVQAQPVERNLPAAPKAPETVIAAPPMPGSINDDRALGARLSSIVILGAKDAAASGPIPPGLDTRALARLSGPRAKNALSRFLGRPITRRLISQIETEIVLEYRRQGFPFVEVSTPEQEITQGALQIRVVEFRVGKIEVAHATGQAAVDIKRQIRTHPGGEIDSRALAQDLDWLNLYPGRTVSPTFTPGGGLGQTDLDLTVTHTRPWSLTGGYANSGSPLTGMDRYFLGGTVAGHLFTDEELSVQVTGSPDFWATQGKLFANNAPLYESAAGRLQIATAPRQDLEVTLNAVESNEAVYPFVIRQQTLEAIVGYRSALSNLIDLPGDISGGLEFSRQMRNTYFGGVRVLFGAVNVYQLYGDWTNRWSDRFGATSLDVSVHGSPGGVGRHDTSAAFADFTDGRVLRAAYVYGEANVTRQTKLPYGFSVITQFNGQYAGQPIPDSQQIALGGQTSVRGYSLDDGAWDDGAVLRDALNTPAVRIARLGPFNTSFAARAFADYGFGRSESARRNVNVASVGLGADLRLGSAAVASVDLSDPLIDAKVTRAGDLHFDARLTLAY